jgi:hypothetical protein
MEQKPMKLDKASMLFATYRAKERVNFYLEIAQQIKEDLRKKERLEASECKACFYAGGRVGGATITYR